MTETGSEGPETEKTVSEKTVLDHSRRGDKSIRRETLEKTTLRRIRKQKINLPKLLPFLCKFLCLFRL